MQTLFQLLSLMVLTNLSIWVSSNSRFLFKDASFSLMICMILGMVSAYLSYFTTYLGYGKFTMWELRMTAFAASYITFPFLTWKYFGESPLEPKTLVSIGMSILLLCVQVFWK